MYYLEKAKKHFCNWFSYGKEHLLRFITVSCLLILFCFVLTLFPTLFENGEQHIFIFDITLSNWSIWLGIIAIAGTGIWAFYEYDKSRISTQQEKASEIARIFSDSLLVKCNIVIAVYENSELSQMLKQFNTLNSPFEHFTTDELREITNNDDFPSLYKEFRDSIDFDYLYFRVLEKKITTKSDYSAKYNLIDKDKDKNKNKNKNKDKDKDKNKDKKEHQYSTKEAQDLFILNNSSFPFHFFNLVDEVLNTLEYVCMNISSHAAGSIFIYQSIHQIFFDTVNILAFEISTRNDGKYSDKFYTNIIHVYNEWQKSYKKSRKNEATKKDQNKKMLNPKIKTVE